LIVAIDGPAGVGKSTIAREIADRAAFFYISSGKFYRAIAFQTIKEALDLTNRDSIIILAKACNFTIQDGKLFVNDHNVEPFLHTDDVDKVVAQVSSIPKLRDIVNTSLRRAVKGLDVVMEGRDITTVVFPDAEVKIFLDASAETRALRRFRQGTSNLTLEEITHSIRQRDEIDRNKPVGSLKISDQAFYIDSSDLTIDQVCEKVLKKIFEVDQKVNQEKHGSDD
jgi:cytidylate kinase